MRILLFSSLAFKMTIKNKFKNKNFFAYYFLKVLFHNFSKVKSHKMLNVEGSRSGVGSGSIPLTNGSGSRTGGPKTRESGFGTLLLTKARQDRKGKLFKLTGRATGLGCRLFRHFPDRNYCESAPRLLTNHSL
jgi:hypothetical protein